MTGAILSLVTIFLMLAYAVFKLDNLIGLKDYRVQQVNRVQHYDGDDKFGSEEGYAIAAGIIEWDEGEGMVEDPSYGVIRLYIK